jgi:hypothetical protein
MKLRIFLLSISLAANAALIAVIAQRAPATDTNTSAGKTAAAAKTSALQPETWTALRPSDDLPALVARLREAGFPPEIVRAIVSAEISERFAARRKALLADQAELPFWKARSFSSPYDAKTMATMRALSREQSDLLRQLLGPDSESGNEMMRAYQQGNYGNLSAAKSEQLQRILSDYGELRSQIYSTANGLMLPEDRTKLALLEKEQRADIAALLTPQELEEYDLRSSSTASQLRYQLASFNATEEEFRAIFKIQKAFDDQFGPSMALTMEQRRQRMEGQKQLLPQIQAVLSPDRFAAYQRATDPQFQQIDRLVARLELPPATADQVIAVQKDIMQRAASPESMRDLTPEQRAAQMAALNQEATAKLTQALGARGFAAYKANSGYWLQMLQPRPAPTVRGP